MLLTSVLRKASPHRLMVCSIKAPNRNIFKLKLKDVIRNHQQKYLPNLSPKDETDIYQNLTDSFRKELENRLSESSKLYDSLVKDTLARVNLSVTDHKRLSSLLQKGKTSEYASKIETTSSTVSSYNNIFVSITTDHLDLSKLLLSVTDVDSEDYAVVIKLFGRKNDLSSAISIFQQFENQKSIEKNRSVVYDAILDTLLRHRKVQSAMDLFHQLIPDVDLNQASQLYHREMKGQSPSTDIEMFTHTLLIRRPRPSMATFTILIDGLRKLNYLDDALKYYHIMKSCSLDPFCQPPSADVINPTQLRSAQSAVIKLYVKLDYLHQVQSLWVARNGKLDLDDAGYNAIWVLFARRKRWDFVQQVFDEMQQKNIAVNQKAANVVLKQGCECVKKELLTVVQSQALNMPSEKAESEELIDSKRILPLIRHLLGNRTFYHLRIDQSVLHDLIQIVSARIELSSQANMNTAWLSLNPSVKRSGISLPHVEIDPSQRGSNIFEKNVKVILGKKTDVVPNIDTNSGVEGDTIGPELDLLYILSIAQSQLKIQVVDIETVNSVAKALATVVLNGERRDEFVIARLARIEKILKTKQFHFGDDLTHLLMTGLEKEISLERRGCK
ncbi:hypothetical protein BKA69DRAFT_1164838 [Paraphysoderma sedebokerense]|nr:hypothetical protein BKA69DRAFT_1164838 [Paraphysoderma sedebokerense]